MKLQKQAKNLLKIGLWISSMFILVIGVYIGYIFSDLNKDIDKKEIESIITEIKNAKQHDERLVLMYNKVYNNILEKSSLENLWNGILGKPYTLCPCRQATLMSRLNKRDINPESTFVITSKIEKELSQRDCLNYIFDKFDYLYGAIGVENAAQIYFQKNLSELTEDELIGLVVMHKNPSLYNPKRYKKRHDDKVNEFKNRLQLE